MTLTSIIGQPLAVELARRWLARQTTHPMLFYGPDGVGKRTLALALAQELHGTNDHRIADGHHPDVRVIGLASQAALLDEPVEKQLSLKIETIQEERRRLLQSAVEGGWKVSIIDDAHKLTADAANVLLKILEEPPPRTALILLTPYRDRLFATIRSRCQPVRFRPLNDEEMKKVLAVMDLGPFSRRRREKAGDEGGPHPFPLPSSTGEGDMRLIELAQGSPGRALHVSREEEIQAAEEAETLWEKRAELRPADILQRAEGRGKAARLTRIEAEQKMRHLMTPALRALRAQDPNAESAVLQIEAALRQVRQNVQPALAYENLLLQLALSSS